MKKIWNVIFKDWTIFDYCILALIVVTPAIANFFINTNSILMLCGCFVEISSLFAFKRTSHGYCLGILSLGWLSYYLYENALYGTFASCLLIILLLIYLLMFSLIKNLELKSKFNMYDWIVLICSLIAVAYPAYLLFVVVHCINPIFEVVNLSFTIIICYLEIKGIKAGNTFLLVSLVAMINFILLFNIQYLTEIVVLGLISVFILIYSIAHLIMALIKTKSKKLK